MTPQCIASMDERVGKVGVVVSKDGAGCLEFQTKGGTSERWGLAVLAYVYVPRCVVTT
jgi:hypothetical protein